MRTLLIICFLKLLSPGIVAQNVGIGTVAPSGKLQLNHRSSSFNPSLVIFDSSTSGAGRIKFFNAGGNRFWQISSIVNNTNPGGQYMDIITDSLYIMTLRGNGNVGINNLAPAYRLDVGGDGYIDGILRVNDKIGLGVTNPAEKLDINGNINLTGLIKINGSGGSAGQVLTSNGAGDPQWKNAAYGNNSRFAATIPNNTDGSNLSYTTIYNLNPADVVISGTTITINKSGLWHFEGYTVNEIRWSAVPAAMAISSAFVADGIDHVIIQDGPMDRNPMNAVDVEYMKTLSFSNDVYISAPATIRLSRGISLIAGGASLVGRLTYGLVSGYLISE